MNKAGNIIAVNPPNALPGGEVLIECENLKIEDFADFKCYFDGRLARITGASDGRILAVVPENLDSTETEVYLENGGERGNSLTVTVGKKIADDLHLVANPAVDPKDDSIILTRSGSRGQQLPVTLFRLGKDGFLDEMPANIMNPTGIAFDESGNLFVTNRADGEVCRINFETEVVPYATNLGIPTGLAFDRDGAMYVGDRSGTIFRVNQADESEVFAALEPSVAAYHLAFGRDDALYVTSPSLASFDAVYRVDNEGYEEIFYRGLGRPQGLAFDKNGNLYVAASFRGRRGIVKISEDGGDAELFVAGMNVIGLCFTRRGEMIVVTNESVYRLPLGIEGTLLKVKREKG